MEEQDRHGDDPARRPAKSIGRHGEHQTEAHRRQVQHAGIHQLFSNTQQVQRRKYRYQEKPQSERHTETVRAAESQPEQRAQVNQHRRGQPHGGLGAPVDGEEKRRPEPQSQGFQCAEAEHQGLRTAGPRIPVAADSPEEAPAPGEQSRRPCEKGEQYGGTGSRATAMAKEQQCSEQREDISRFLAEDREDHSGQ